MAASFFVRSWRMRGRSMVAPEKGRGGSWSRPTFATLAEDCRGTGSGGLAARAGRGRPNAMEASPQSRASARVNFRVRVFMIGLRKRMSAENE